jgi:EmrB/QacA subfamily drug resistance transporter
MQLRNEEDRMNPRRGTLAVVSLATAVLMLDIAVVNTALPHIARDLDAGLSGIQWVVDAYTLALASVVLSAGSVADRIGRKKVFTIGMVVFTASSVACALAGDIVVLDVSRAVQGLGGAILFATSLSLLAEAFPKPADRTKALAVYGATIGASFAFGPLVGGALTTGFGWQAVFLVNVPLGIAGLVGTARWVKESRDPNARRLDWGGQATLSAGLFLLVLALLRGNDDGWSSALIVGELAGAAVLFAAFVAIERRVASPMLPLGLFRRPDFTGAQVAAFSISASLFAVFLYTTIYLQSILGLSALEAGLVYMPATLLNFVVAGATAQLANRFAPGALISVGLALVAAGLLMGTMLGPDSSWLLIEPCLMVSMIGTGMFNPAVSAVALGSAPQEMSGVAAGANDTFRQAGIAVGVAAFGAMIPSASALGGGSPADYVDGLHAALIAGAGLAAVGAIASAKLIGVGRPRNVVAVAAAAPVADPC